MSSSIRFLIIFFIIAFPLLSQDLYDIDTIQNIEITFEEDNWEDILHTYYSEGQEERLVGNAVLNGIVFDSVGVRFKGNSSYRPENRKNPLNIKLDHIIKDQEYQGYGTLRLSNGYKDPTQVREVLSYEMARKYMPASRANYIKVTINGDYLGLYTSVQDVDKNFLNEYYYSKNNPFFKGELIHSGGTTIQQVWGYAGSDESRYANNYELKSDDGWDDLIGFLYTFNNDVDNVETVLNVDRHLWMLAFDVLMVNLDAPINFGHNFYLYQDDAGRFNPIVWDLNENFGVFVNLMGQAGPGQKVGGLDTNGLQELDLFFNAENDTYPIIKQILSIPSYRKMYVAHMKTLINDLFASGWYIDRANELQYIIDAEVQADPNQFYSYNDFKNNITQSLGGGQQPGRPAMQVIGIQELMETRSQFLLNQPEMQAGAPAIQNWDLPSSQVAYTSFSITATVTNATQVLFCYRDTPENAFQKIEMLDDGIHADGEAGDNVYGTELQPDASDIQYYLYAVNEDAAVFEPQGAESSCHSIAIVGDLVINELMADNETVLSDSEGEYNDWLELYNNSSETISLAGYALSDDADEPSKWIFPDTTIGAKSYLIVWLDDDEGEGLHASFKLAASGETLLLSNPEQVVIDQVVFGEQTEDLSYARMPNGTGSFDVTNPTPAAINSEVTTGVVSEKPLMVETIQLLPNYPNPFNPVTTLFLSISKRSDITLKIVNILGKEVATLIDDTLEAGSHTAIWNAENMPSGVYLAILNDGQSRHIQRLMLLK